MRNKSRFALLWSVLAGSTLLATTPLLAQGRPMMGAPHPAAPSFHAAPIHGAAPGHVLSMPAGPRGGFAGGARPVMRVHPLVFQHHDIAHFTTAETAAWHAGWWHHGWWHGRWGWWWFAGGFWWWYDAPIYPWPTYVSTTYYVEPTYEDTSSWYYCYNPPGYYPYVQYCNGPWQPVPTTPPGGSYDSGPQGYQDQGGPPPQGYDQAPPPGYGQGPPQGYNDEQGPPPGDDQGPPPGSDQGPPPSDDQGPPRNN